jgi:predicted kinase
MVTDREPGQVSTSTGGAVLILVCGLPGAGKTTMARSLATERAGVRLCPDEWLGALGMTLWDEPLRERVETLQWNLAQDLLRLGAVVIIEWGCWGRDERDQLRTTAQVLQARVELVFLDPPIEELWRRIEGRGQEEPPISRHDLEHWNTIIERPDQAELGGYDCALVITD